MKIRECPSLFAEAHNPVIFVSPAMYHAAANLSIVKGVAVSVPLESNAKGVLMMGVAAEGKAYKEMVKGGPGLLYAVGEVPLTERPKTDFLVVQHSHLTALAKQADVVLPAAAFFEAPGTILDYNGRLKNIVMAVAPAGEAKAHREIFTALAGVMGSKMKEAKETDTKKLANIKAKITVQPFARREGFDVKPDELIESVNASMINGSRILWLKEAPVTT